MKSLRSVLVMVTAALVAALAAPVVAMPLGASVESYKTDGLVAIGSWSAPDGVELAVGMPRVIYVQGADAIQTYRVSGSKPVRQPQQSVVAFATMLLDPNGEPYPAEVWGLADDATFTINRELSQASLAFDCEAVIVVWDPVLEEEVVTGETLPLSVTATWTGAGSLTTVKSHSKYSEEGLFTIDLNRGTTRVATVELTLTSPDGVLFDGVMEYGEMGNVRGASMVHFLP